MSADDFERWELGGVCPTLNVGDNTGDVRATVVMVQPIGFSHTQGLDAQPSESAWPTLRSNGGGHAVSASTVRRLTPVECERLQGFPDNWTAGQADSHRYKQMGNAVSVPVANYVAFLVNDAIVTGHSPCE